MKILITGVYGVVGSDLCSELSKDHEIIGIGRKNEYNGCSKYYSCDITETEKIEEILMKNKDLDIIIHCAALAHSKGTDLSYNRFMKVNYEATKYFVDLSNKILNLKNFIFVSTISVYGEEINKDIYLEGDNLNPKSPYAVAKKKSEDYIAENYNRNYSIIRLAPVYSKNFLLNIERRTKIKGKLYKVGKGDNKLSLCNIKNIYQAVDYIVNNWSVEKNSIYNISDKKEYTYDELVRFMGDITPIVIPKFLMSILYNVNKISLKKQFIHENTIKLITDNIYSSDKIRSKADFKYTIKDVKKV